MAGAGIAGDIRIIQNNLRNTSTLAYSSNSNGFFVFPESVEAIFTNDDVVSVGTTVSIGSTTLQPSIDYYICNSNGETEFKYYDKKILPEVGKVLIYPAAYTHTHRGNPPIGKVKWFFQH